jgi:precorrin-6B methylase 2
VLDAGAGSGILSFFAAEAGAGRVLAVEIDPFLADCLQRSIRANGLSNRIEVICGDVREVDLPKRIDVFIGELIDTGHLTGSMRLGATNAFSGDRIVPIDPIVLRKGQVARAQINFTLGGGLASLRIQVT